MSFLSSERIIFKAEELVKPFLKERVKYGAYELGLGSEAIISDNKSKESYETGKQIIIPPGQFALLITDEEVSIPPSLLGFISIKFSSKKLGLVNISGFHVDPGFVGKLKFSVYNAGSRPVFLTVGNPLFLIWFANLDEETKDFRKPERTKWLNLSDDDTRETIGDIASPAVLKERLDKVENKIKIYGGIVVTLALFIVGRFLWGELTESKQPSQPNSNTITTPLENVSTIDSGITFNTKSEVIIIDNISLNKDDSSKIVNNDSL